MHFLNSRFTSPKFIASIIIGIDWTKTEFIKDLSFDKCEINYSVFESLSIPNTKLVSCTAHEVDFSQANLSDSDLSFTDFEKSIFFKTNLTSANFTGAKKYYIDSRTNTIKNAQFSLPDALSLLEVLEVFIS